MKGSIQHDRTEDDIVDTESLTALEMSVDTINTIVFFLPFVQQSEKENLLKERDHILSTLGETKQNLTGLCQQVCKEAALSPEQIQILAKYSASDCPLSFLISEKGKSTPDSELAFTSVFSVSDVPPTAPSSCGRGSSIASQELVQESQPTTTAAPEQATLLEPCRQSAGISDFCQQMSDKCTTDE